MKGIYACSYGVLCPKEFPQEASGPSFVMKKDCENLFYNLSLYFIIAIRAGRPWFGSLQGHETFLYSTDSRRALGTNPAYYLIDTGVFIPGSKEARA
jgi:hypothetical protein